jgi:hypothetical protein
VAGETQVSLHYDLKIYLKTFVLNPLKLLDDAIV